MASQKVQGRQTTTGGQAPPAEQPTAPEPQADRVRPLRAVRRKLPTPWVLVPGLAVLLAWQLASGTLVRDTYISRPTDIVERLIGVFQSGEIYPHIITSGTELGMGYLIGFTGGAAIGYALGRSKRLSTIFEPYILAFYGIPKIALAPLFIIWFGIGIWSKVALSALMVFFLVFFNVFMGVRNVERVYVDVARIMGADQTALTRHVYLPAAMPHVLMGMRAALPYGVIGVIVGEFISAREGLGLFMYTASATYDPAGLFAGIAIVLLFILVANALLGVTERRLLRWKPDNAAQGAPS